MSAAPSLIDIEAVVLARDELASATNLLTAAERLLTEAAGHISTADRLWSRAGETNAADHDLLQGSDHDILDLRDAVAAAIREKYARLAYGTTEGWNE